MYILIYKIFMFYRKKNTCIDIRCHSYYLFFHPNNPQYYLSIYFSGPWTIKVPPYPSSLEQLYFASSLKANL